MDGVIEGDIRPSPPDPSPPSFVDGLGREGNADVVEGTAGDDTIRGWGGNDILSGNEGDDIIFGGWGEDTSSGDAGDDVMFVVLGPNTVVFASNGGADTVVGYKPGVDEFDLTAVAGVDSFNDLALTDKGDDMLVDYGSGAFLLKNTDLGSVEAGDFLI
jgi:Ca2+-binding RTX toxin-like protein